MLQGRVEQVVAVSDVPFSWDKVEAVKTVEELKAKFESVIKSKGVRNLQAGDATFLKGEEATQAADRAQTARHGGIGVRAGQNTES